MREPSDWCKKNANGDNGVVTAATLPRLELPSVDGSPVRLDEVLAGSVAVVLFVTEECPTCAMTLRRLAAPAGDLAAAGISVTAIFEDPLEVAARSARGAGFRGTVLSEPEPYELSRSLQLQSVPTTLLFDPEGSLLRRVVGWDREGLDDLLGQASALAGAPAVRVTGEHPVRKPGCAAKSTYDAETLAALNAAGPHDELEDMFERGWSDGLPVIPPTRERVDAMLGGRDPSLSLGEVPPAMGEATLERVASCAVLAGCRPEYFPVVVAAVQAALEPAFNLNGQAVTTQPAGQLVILNGPARHSLGLNSSIGALGPGRRANLTIGRALRLLISLTGGGFPGKLDRATLGHAGKIGFCMAENEEVSPWEPLSVQRGFESGHIGRHGGGVRRAAVDLRSPQRNARGARQGARGGSGRDVESELVAAGWGVAVRDLPRARTAVRRSRMEQAATARGDVRGGAPSCRRAALGRDHAARARRPRRPPDLQVVQRRGHTRGRGRWRGRTLFGGVRPVPGDANRDRL